MNTVRQVSEFSSTKGCEDAVVLTTHPLFFLYYSNTAITKHHLGVALTTALEIAGTFGFYGSQDLHFLPFQHPHFSPYYLRHSMHNYEMMLPSCGKLNLPYGLLGKLVPSCLVPIFPPAYENGLCSS